MQRYSTEDINNSLQNLNGWFNANNAIEKHFIFKDFNEAFAFLARIALLSEKMNHHADWSGVYNKVTIKLSTHDAGGVTKKDIDFATQAETYL